ncbi:hypothetical protein Cylst_0316 [Cylindrospermum stagnale PCC 7417]|uniref:Uncharacterized protein n=1 Tax=Cylindrospermum stagnale PCC 7417 TaxID=56107 RepID=K9WSA8_9NOST|nr:hypothetical protein [Cylindrospermum stagnale]AFZ22679.1 hypothetical protein Cylst_0316 [Cylindrospermum stagnale PCC 7417]
MYSGQHRTSKKSANSSDKAVPSRFAPRGFVVQPKTEEVAPQQDQTPDLEPQREETKQYKDGFIDFSKLTPRPSPARTPRIQMKLTRLQPGDMYQQEPVPSSPIAVQPKANTDLSPAQNTTLEPFDKVEEVANEAVEIQRLREPGESGDDGSHSPNGGIIQRACSECEAEKEEKKDTGIIQAKEQIAGFNKNLFKPSLLNKPTHTLQAKTIEEQSSKTALNNNKNEFSLTKQSPTPLPAKEISSQNPQIVQMMPKVKPGSMTLKEAQQALKRLNGELGLELAQTAADLAGLADPTPISDGVGAAISIARGDYVGAGLSLISMVPYVGDAAGKPIKAARNGKRILKLRKEIAELINRINHLNPGEIKKAEEIKGVVSEQMKKALTTRKRIGKSKGIKHPEISAVAPDWGSKGAHIKVGDKGVEIAVRPGQNGSIVLKSVFSKRFKKEYVEEAIKEGNKALEDPQFRKKLYEAGSRALQQLSRSKAEMDRARAVEIRFLMIALKKKGL